MMMRVMASKIESVTLNVPVEGGYVHAEVIEVTKLTTDEPIRWKLLARELGKPRQEGSIPIDRLNASKR